MSKNRIQFEKNEELIDSAVKNIKWIMDKKMNFSIAIANEMVLIGSGQKIWNKIFVSSKQCYAYFVVMMSAVISSGLKYNINGNGCFCKINVILEGKDEAESI